MKLITCAMRAPMCPVGPASVFAESANANHTPPINMPELSKLNGPPQPNVHRIVAPATATNDDTIASRFCMMLSQSPRHYVCIQ